MSSEIDIRRAYLEDKKHPFYSVQAGKPYRMAVPVFLNRDILLSDKRVARIYHSDPRWTWGHFHDALMRALAS